MKKKKKPKGRKRKRGRKSRTVASKKQYGSVSRSVSSPKTTEEETFGFNSGSDFTLEDFEKYARYFKDYYFGRKDNAGDTEWTPTVEEIEGEYWRIIEQPTDEVEVHKMSFFLVVINQLYANQILFVSAVLLFDVPLQVSYGADLENRVLGSGFYKRGDMKTGRSDMDPYIASGWNLNNLPRLPGSLLSFEDSHISGVLVPWLYIGMCFSTFCWVSLHILSLSNHFVILFPNSHQNV